MRWRGTGPRYRDHLLTLGLTPKTVAIYSGLVERAWEWCEARGERLPTLRAEAAGNMAREIVPRSSSSRRQLRSALQHYWRMLDIPDPPVRAIPVPSKPEGRWRGLELDEAERLVKASRGWFPEGTSVLLALGLGLRVSETAALRWDAFDRALEWVRIVGKGDRARDLYVHPGLARELRPTAATQVFPGYRGRVHVAAYTVQTWLDRVLAAAGVRAVTPHQLRHTAIGQVHDETGDVRAAQVFAGHARVETTQIYTRVKARRLVAAAEALTYLE